MATDKDKPDFSNVKSGTRSTAPTAPKADFGNVKSGARSTAPIVPKADFSNVGSSVASTAPLVAPAAQHYTVAKGDSLSKIAKKFYGNANRWKEIHQANLDTIKNPDLIRIGQVIVIPADTKAKP